MIRTRFSLRPRQFIPILIIAGVVASAIAARAGLLSTFAVQMIIATFAAAVLALGLWTIRRTYTRIVRLTAVAEAIQNGDYSARSKESGGDPLGLQARVLNRVAERVQGVAQELEVKEDKIRRMASHDLLTGLPNRRLFEDLLSKELARAARGGQHAAVVLFDLDHFKDINDGLGSEAGDQLLQSVAEGIASMMRQEDTLARLGGDEFALLATDIKRAEDVLALLKRVSARFLSPFQFDQRELVVSCSMGISLYPDDGKYAQELMTNADAALSRAKSMGGSNFQTFAPSMTRWARERLEMEQDLRRGLQQHAPATWRRRLQRKRRL